MDLVSSQLWFAGFPEESEKISEFFSLRRCERALECRRALEKPKKKGKTREPTIASRVDIDQAIEKLSTADERRLEQFAKFKIKGLGRKARGQDNKELLQQAIESVYVGADDPENGRHWPINEVEFVPFLIGVMRSIASHWGDSFSDREAYLETEVVSETDEGELISPLDNVQSAEPLPDRTLIAKEELGSILKSFAGDDDAILIIEAWAEGMTSTEIVEGLGMPKERLEAGAKRIRYHVRAR